uniref:Uncharacterized protein n=1 Tax=Rhizophora mucronata TaxID=61149 RepID=A0A2P2QV60_RHIMU
MLSISFVILVILFVIPASNIRMDQYGMLNRKMHNITVRC